MRFSIEKICNSISQIIGEEFDYSNEQISVIKYGLFALFEITYSIFLIVIFGKLFGVMTEALIISFTISILRKSSGGAHASTPRKCAMFGMIVSVGMALIIKFVNVSVEMIILLGMGIFILAYILLYKLAPVDSIAKPIKKAENIQRLKKSSIIILTVYLIIVLINFIWYLRSGEIRILIYLLCIYDGLLIQVLSLTRSGHKLLNKMDALF